MEPEPQRCKVERVPVVCHFEIGLVLVRHSLGFHAVGQAADLAGQTNGLACNRRSTRKLRHYPHAGQNALRLQYTTLFNGYSTVLRPRLFS